mgnify:FL=1
MIVMKPNGRRFLRDAPMLDAAALEPGDRVATVSRNYGGSSAIVHTVERLTATQVVMSGERSLRFRRDTGTAVGDSYCQLLALNDPEVLSAFQSMAVRRAAGSIGVLVRDLASPMLAHQQMLDLCVEISRVANETADRLRETEATPRAASE